MLNKKRFLFFCLIVLFSGCNPSKGPIIVKNKTSGKIDLVVFKTSGKECDSKFVSLIQNLMPGETRDHYVFLECNEVVNVSMKNEGIVKELGQCPYYENATFGLVSQNGTSLVCNSAR